MALQDLHESEDPNTMRGSKDRDEVIKEGRGPRDLGEEKKKDLKDNEQLVDDGKHGTTGLQRNASANRVNHRGGRNRE